MGPPGLQVPEASGLSATASVTLTRNESLLLVAPLSFAEERTPKKSLARFYLITPEWRRED